MTSSPIVIGLTGNIATGKTTVARMLGRLGAETIDADKVAHSVMRPGTQVHADIVDAFGPQILTPEGTIDRRQLGRLVFSDKEALARLEAIVHPATLRAINRRIASPSAKPAQSTDQSAKSARSADQSAGESAENASDQSAESAKSLDKPAAESANNPKHQSTEPTKSRLDQSVKSAKSVDKSAVEPAKNPAHQPAECAKSADKPAVESARNPAHQSAGPTKNRVEKSVKSAKSVDESMPRVVVIEAIKLFESGLADRCDSVWVTTCRRDQQIERLVQGRNLTQAEARQRVDAQVPQEERAVRADVVIDNSGSLLATWRQVLAAWRSVVGEPDPRAASFRNTCA